MAPADKKIFVCASCNVATVFWVVDREYLWTQKQFLT